MRTLPPEYSIVRAEAQHIAALSAIELAAAPLLRGYAPPAVLLETTGIATFCRAADAGRLWVAVRDNTPVGFAIVEMLAHDLPHLDEIDVDPAHGRRGVGAALVREVCDWSASNGFNAITLTTFREPPWNMPFYAGLGFVELHDGPARAELRSVVANEARRGLDPERRVVMARDTAPTLRPAVPADREELFDIWLRSARATHAFVSAGDLESFEPLVREYLTADATEFWVLSTARGVVMGFMGLGAAEVESLFLAPEFHRRGAGRRLIEHARARRGELTVKVNEQNTAAVNFYAACGFAVEGRSELDDNGRPYPLLHMRRLTSPARTRP